MRTDLSDIKAALAIAGIPNKVFVGQSMVIVVASADEDATLKVLGYYDLNCTPERTRAGNTLLWFAKSTVNLER